MSDTKYSYTANFIANIIERYIKMTEWIRKNNNKDIEIKNVDGVELISFKKLEETGMVRQGFSTRMGGVSKGIFSTMNLSFNRGDDKAAVEENFRRIAKALSSSTENMVFSDQTHTANIRVVTEADRGKGIHYPLDYKDIDGLVTNEKNIMLVTFYADCVPIYLVDTVNKAIGLCHSGWRGTTLKISCETLKVMNEQYSTKTENVLAVIGPSICQDCYEVSEDVIEEFIKKYGKDNSEKIAYKKDYGKYQLDLWKANKIALLEAGVLDENITVTDICTCCNSELLFSHRASNGKRGNLAAFLELK